MTTKKREFQLIGTLRNHPDFPEAQRGDVLKLEVGDDNLPTSELLRSRVRPLGERIETDESGGDAKAIVADAKAKAKEIIAKAKEDAAAITDKANADAAELLKAASGE